MSRRRPAGDGRRVKVPTARVESAFRARTVVNQNAPRKSAFLPELNVRCRVLLLGTLPGEVSLAAAQYYAHPSNQFWRLIGPAIGVDLTDLSYPARLQALRAAGVGLGDVLASGMRFGSADASIRAAQAANLPALVARLPELQAVAFNGGKAAKVGRRQLSGADVALVSLPSSSAAYCAMSLTEKQRRWAALAIFLGRPF